MTRDFVGTGSREPVSYDVHVEDAGKRYSMTHRVWGSYISFQWDGGGPGSTDLARALLWEVTGAEPEWQLYRLFKNEVVATWPHHAGECWRISDTDIERWLAGVERDTAETENPDQTKARLEQSGLRELRLRGYSQSVRRSEKP